MPYDNKSIIPIVRDFFQNRYHANVETSRSGDAMTIKQPSAERVHGKLDSEQKNELRRDLQRLNRHRVVVNILCAPYRDDSTVVEIGWFTVPNSQ